VRLFVASEVPTDLRERLRRMQVGFRSNALRIRWVRVEGIHLTFKFLGEAEPERVAAIVEALSVAARPCAPFLLSAGGLGVFPERGDPRVLWVGVGGDLPEAARLQQRIEGQLETLGFPRERRPFSPHLTLGRVRGKPAAGWKSDLERLAETGAPGSLPVSECVLFESRLDASGAIHSALARVPFSGSRG
jgi:RNA 2',3'-cyclic 3'-phosphodiesterase